MEQAEKTATFDFLLEQWSLQEKHSINASKLAVPRGEEVVIGARIRPILPKEAEEGHVQGVFPRDLEGQVVNVVDVHQMVLGGVVGARLRVRLSHPKLE